MESKANTIKTDMFSTVIFFKDFSSVNIFVSVKNIIVVSYFLKEELTDVIKHKPRKIFIKRYGSIL